MKENKLGENLSDIFIRNETPDDYAIVEDLTRQAFYNMYVPGCYEHYLVHIMRSHKDFIPELAFVLELCDRAQIIGNIMYTRAKLIDEHGSEKIILTLGPICISPEHQRKGYGKFLMQHSFERARALGYNIIVLFGSPMNYVSSGFVSCKRHNICIAMPASAEEAAGHKGDDGELNAVARFPAAMMVKELVPGTLDGRRYFYRESPVFEFDVAAAQKFDDTLVPLPKGRQPSQEEFFIMSNSVIV